MKDARDNPFRKEFWNEADGVSPSVDTVLLFFLLVNVISTILFTLSILFISDEWNWLVSLILFTLLSLFGNHFFYKLSKNTNIASNNNIDIQKCRKCVAMLDSNSFYLAQYGLIKDKPSKEEDAGHRTLQSIESELACDDEVIIYTSLQGTESNVIDTVRKNAQKGVKYTLIYYGMVALSKEEESLYHTILHLPESESNIDSKLAENKSGFDLFCLKKKTTGNIEAYFAVNYSVKQSDIDKCIKALAGDCKPADQCNKDNSFSFYKELEPTIASGLFSKLSEIVLQYNGGQS